jgi:hypothetical protein
MKSKKLTSRIELNPFGIEMRNDNAFEGNELDIDCKGGSFRTQVDGWVEKKRKEHLSRGLKNDYGCLADYGIRMFCSYHCSKCKYGKKI